MTLFSVFIVTPETNGGSRKFDMGGKGVARGVGRVAGVDGTWQSLYVNCFNKTNIKHF